MDMNARYQYLKVLQERYFGTKSRKEKSLILDEYCNNTSQNRKYVVRRIRSPLCSHPVKRRRKCLYDGYVKVALVKVWEIFDHPCGQRFAPILKEQVDNLRELGELAVPDEVAEKLKRIAPATIDRKLKHQKEVLHLKRKYGRSRNPLIYQMIPVKAGGWDKNLPGQIQIDLVEHCGSSASGLFGNTVNSCDIATGWWEAGAVLGKGQEGCFSALHRMRERTPFFWCEIHPDNDTPFINWHLMRYCEKEEIQFSRSRPYKKNDNCFVEQKNSTHVRNVVGHLRYDTEEEIQLMNGLYKGELRLYKNFFQPVMKLKEKIRVKGKLHRRYDTPKTPYHRLMESEHLPETTKSKLQTIYRSLNPAQLKRDIDEKLDKLYKIYQEKNTIEKVEPCKRQKPLIVTF